MDGGEQEGMGPIASACLAGKQKLAHTTHSGEPGRRAGWLLSETHLNLPRSWFFLPSHSPRRVEWTYGWIRTIMGKLPVAKRDFSGSSKEFPSLGKPIAQPWDGRVDKNGASSVQRQP